MKSPLLPLAACFGFGILLARPQHLAIPEALLRIPVLLGAGAACLLAGLISLRIHSGGRRQSPSNPTNSRPIAGEGGTVTDGNVSRATPLQQGKWLTVCEVCALAGFVFGGSAAGRLFEIRFPPNHISHLESLGIRPGELALIEGHLVSVPRRSSSGLQFELETVNIAPAPLSVAGQIGGPAIRSHSVSGRIRLWLNAGNDFAAVNSLRLRYGDSIRVPVSLRRPRVYRNPGTFDFRNWMESIEDIYWVGTIKGPQAVEKLSIPTGASIDVYLKRIRTRLLEGIDHLYPPWTLQGRDGAVLKAALLGDRSAIDSDTIENFRKAGLYHLLVIAGLHVGLLAMLAELLLRLLRFRETWRSVLVLALLAGYAFVVEQRAPTLRATLMISVYLLARLFYRRHTALNAIGLAGLVLLVARPAWLFESGFQLSFSAALIIVGLAGPLLERTTEPYRRALRALHEVDLDPALEPRQAQFRLDLRMLITALRRSPFLEVHPRVAAALVTAPVRIALWTANILLFSAVLQLGLMLPMAETFHRVTYAGIGLNAVAIPVMTVLLAIAAPLVILAAVSPVVAVWPAKALALVMQSLFALTDLSGLPAWLSYRIPGPPSWVAWGFAISIITAACTLSRSRLAFRCSLAALACFALLISLHPFKPRAPSGVLEVTALDCGTGEALFLVLPDRSTILLNTGAGRTGRFDQGEGTFERRRWDPGEEIVSPYLWSRGLKRIDVVVLTTAGQLSGLSAILDNFRIGEIWYARPATATPPTPRAALPLLLAKARQRGIVLRELIAQDLLSRGGTSIQVLRSPFPAKSATADGSGDRLVLRISADGQGVATMGRTEEREWGDRASPEIDYGNVSPRAAALLLGTRETALASAPEILMRVVPGVAIIRGDALAGSRLQGSHPREQLQSHPTQVFRTDSDGAVTIQINRDGLRVQCYAHACLAP